MAPSWTPWKHGGVAATYAHTRVVLALALQYYFILKAKGASLELNCARI